MSIVLTFKVAEGVVLAADSRLTIREGERVVLVSDSQEKIVQLTSQVGVLICGAGFLGGRSAVSWVESYRRTLDEIPKPVSELAQGLLEFVPFADDTSTTFMVVGFSPGAKEGFEAQIIKLNIFANGEKHFFDASDAVSFWDGEFEAVTRLLRGRSPIFSQVFADQGERLVEADRLAQVQVPYYALTLQEGVDWARFLLQAQIQYQRFSSETQTCGGPVDVVVMTPQGGWQWVQRKTLS